MSEFERSYWRSRGRGDKFLGHFCSPTWAAPEIQAVYIEAFNAFEPEEAQAMIG